MGAQWKQKGKDLNAAAKGRVFSKLVKEIMIAARNGADPAMNARLRIAVEAAKKASMPRDTLERGIKKGAGLLDEPVQYETVTYEGFGPHRVPVIVECLTDNRNRTAGNVRQLFRLHQLGAAGSVSWDFDRVGVIEATGPEGADPEGAAIEAGAQDVETDEDGSTVFTTDTTDLDTVTRALTAAGWTVSSSDLAWKAKNPVVLDEASQADVAAFLANIEEDEDVHRLFAGLA